MTLTISAVLASLLLAAVACCSEPESEPAAPAARELPTAPEAPSATPELPADAPASQPGSVSGSVNYQGGVAPGLDAVATVKLQDTSRMDAPAVTLGEQVIQSPGRGPLDFTIEYDPELIDERFTYSVRAEVRERGKLLYTTTIHYPVITRGNATQVELVLEPVAPAMPPAPPAPEVQPPAAQDVLCLTTAMASLPIEFQFGVDRVPTGFDGANLAACTFPELIETVTVVLVPVAGGPTHTAIFTLGGASAQVSFPLPEDLLAMETRAMLPPGEYERRMLATAVSGVVYDLTADYGALDTATILEPVEEPVAPEVLCMSTLAAVLPIEFYFGVDRMPTGFDGINIAGCTFSELIESVTVTITPAGEGGPHSAHFMLEEARAQVSFPLPAGTLGIETAEWVLPGEYSRRLIATAVSGTVYDLTADYGALDTVTILEPEA